MMSPPNERLWGWVWGATGPPQWATRVHVSCLISRAAIRDNVPFRIGHPCCRRHGHPYGFSASAGHNRLFPCGVVFVAKHAETPKQCAHRELGTTPRSVINFYRDPEAALPDSCDMHPLGPGLHHESGGSRADRARV